MLFKNVFSRFTNRLSEYWHTSLDDYYYFAIYRNLGYLLFTLLTGLFAFTALKSYEMYKAFPGTPLSIIGLCAWETALNFGLCLYIMDEWLSRIWKGWGDFENRTVGKVWLIWFAAFLLAFTIQHLILNRAFELYDPKMRLLYYDYPKEKLSLLLSFIYSFPFWLIGVFLLIHIAIRKQRALKADQSNLKDLINQREWIFKQNLDQHRISSIQNTNKLKTTSELLIPDSNNLERINIDHISHINVEDHYCRIFVKKQEEVKDFFIRIPLKDILDQLPNDLFLQIHRSYIINLSYVSSLIKDNRSYQLALNQGTHTLPISRHRLPQVLSVLEKLKG